MGDPLNDALHRTAFAALEQFVDAARLQRELPPGMKTALERGWIVKRGANYYVVPEHRDELDAAFPGDTIYGA